jgi:hypothetical protein
MNLKMAKFETSEKRCTINSNISVVVCDKNLHLANIFAGLHYYTSNNGANMYDTIRKFASKTTLRASISFQILPAAPRTTTTVSWNKNMAPVSLSIIASIAVSLGSGTPLLIPNLVSLPESGDYQ